jgi:serine/threonine protein kinase
VPVAARIVADVCAGLHAAHSSVDDKGEPRPIIHRDVSPHNVMMSKDGHVKLTDFGIAKAADVMTNTPTSVLKGKTPYIAPELIRATNASAITPQVDVFAAGLVLYQLLTFEHPFKRDSELSTFAALVGEEAPPPSARRSDVPTQLDPVIARAIAKETSQRYATARAFGAALEDFIVQSGSAVDSSHVAAWLKAVEQNAAAMGEVPPPSWATPAKLPEPDGPITQSTVAGKT